MRTFEVNPMSDPRITGLTLMALSLAAFVGTTSNMLPPTTFFPALALFAAGAFKFMKSNRLAVEAAEDLTRRAINPRLSENQQVQAQAQRQADRQGSALTHAGELDENANPVAYVEPRRGAPGEAIEIDSQAHDFVVGTDVSFPIEVQSADALADPLRKLSQLLEQGVLTEEEYAVAKAKLLG